MALESFGLYCEVKALYDYSQDGDEESLFYNVALGFLFLGAGKLLEKGFKAWKGARNADEVIELLDDVPPPPPPRIEPPSYNQLKNTPPCFLAGTQVKTPDGEMAIEELTLENTVLVYDFKENCIKEKRILKLFNNWTYRYFEIQTKNNAPILATSKHLFWVENYNEWIPAKELTVGMELKDANNTINSILNIKVINNVAVPTYNFEVEDIHNYFVGKFGLLVHNSNKPSKFASTNKKNIKIYEVYDTRTGETKYVGQTDHADVKDRFKEHLNSKDTKKINRKTWKKHYDVREVKKGNWTPYEASAWEQHYLEKNGGKGSLENGRNEITEKKYNKYGDEKYGHNPCP